MSFSPDWLHLREPYDHQARDASLVGRLQGWIANRPVPADSTASLTILDLGCGAGSTITALAAAISRPQRWILVDRDPALLPIATTRAARLGVPAAALQADLARDCTVLPWDGSNLVTASALIDLVSDAWLSELVATCHRFGLACYLALNYDGRIAWSPEDPDDALVIDGMHADQRSDKGFGPALGPACTTRAAALFETAGFQVMLGDSTWRFGHADGPVQMHLINDWLGAARRRMPGEADRLRAWADRRHTMAAAGGSTLAVGHCDLLALPAETARDCPPSGSVS